MNFVIFGIPVHICPQEIMAAIASLTCLGCAWRWAKARFWKSKQKPKHDHTGCPEGHPETEAKND
jgi:hypothetical protein